MRFQEIDEGPAFGQGHGFPGYGRGLFRQAFYQVTAAQISRLEDPAVKEFIANWFAEIFAKDNPRFRPDTFKQAALSVRYRASRLAQFQQRHFWYLAAEIRRLPDPHVREYLANWIASWAGGSNPNFRRALWDRACGVESTADEEYGSAHPMSDREPKRNRMGYYDADHLGPVGGRKDET